MADSEKPLADRQEANALIRRLLFEQGLPHWRRYLVAFALMGVAAGSTALIAYLIGDVINEVYQKRNFDSILLLGLVTTVLFAAKGFSTYGHSVLLAQIGNRIVADNQRRMFDKLMHQNLSFFADRHTSEFILRLERRRDGGAASHQPADHLGWARSSDTVGLGGGHVRCRTRCCRCSAPDRAASACSCCGSS